MCERKTRLIHSGVINLGDTLPEYLRFPIYKGKRIKRILNIWAEVELE